MNAQRARGIKAIYMVDSNASTEDDPASGQPGLRFPLSGMVNPGPLFNTTSTQLAISWFDLNGTFPGVGLNGTPPIGGSHPASNTGFRDYIQFGGQISVRVESANDLNSSWIRDFNGSNFNLW